MVSMKDIAEQVDPVAVARAMNPKSVADRMDMPAVEDQVKLRVTDTIDSVKRSLGSEIEANRRTLNEMRVEVDHLHDLRSKIADLWQEREEAGSAIEEMREFREMMRALDLKGLNAKAHSHPESVETE